MRFVLLALIFCCVVSLAAAKTIPLVTGNDYAPFTDESLPQGGMVTEIVARAFQQMGYEPSIVFRPWKRGYEETKKGLFAATFPYIKTAERLQDFYYSEPINTVYTRIFVVKDSPIKQLEDLRGRRICVPLGYGVSKSLETILEKDTMNQEENPVDLSGCLKMMMLDRKDFFIINEINGWITIQKTFHTKENFRTLEPVFEEETHHLIFSKDYPDAESILKQFNQAIDTLRQQGTLQHIIDQHLKEILE